MADNCVQLSGWANTIQYSPSGSITAKDVVALTNIVGIAIADGSTTVTPIALAIDGIWQMPKKTTDTFTAGQQVYWDDTKGYVTETAYGNIPCGMATQVKGNTATTCEVLLNVNSELYDTSTTTSGG